MNEHREGDPSAGDEIREAGDDAPEAAERIEVEEQDFAARNVAMTNTLPGQAAAGAIVGSGGELALEPRAGDEGAVDEDEPTAAADRPATEGEHPR